MYDGSCLCGGVTFRLTERPAAFGYCHCRSCRKASGTAHSANAAVPRGAFVLLQGDSLLREYESSPGKFRAFCSRCGSPIYARLAASPDVLRIRLGALDTPFDGQPEVHTFVADKAPWAPIADGLPQFDGFAPTSVMVQAGSRQSVR